MLATRGVRWRSTRSEGAEWGEIPDPEFIIGTRPETCQTRIWANLRAVHLRTPLTTLQAGILARPRTVLAVCLALAAVAVVLGTGVELHTSRDELGSADDPDQQRMWAILADYPGASSLIVVVEATQENGASRQALRHFADALAASLGDAGDVGQVFHRFDLDWLLQRSLHLAPPGAIGDLADTLAASARDLDDLAGTSDLADLDNRLAARLEAATSSADGRGAGESAGSARVLVSLLTAQRDFLADPGAAVSRLEETPALLALAGAAGRVAADGYLSSHDGSVLYLLVSPENSDDSIPALRAFLGKVRRHVDRLLAASPGIRVAFTGEPAINVEEMDTIARDTAVSASVAIAGVTLLTLVVFRWKTHALLVLASLGVGIAWAYGAVRLELGHLNMISSAFLSTLVGVGVAYGVHPVSEYELERAHSRHPLEAVRRSFHLTGAAVTVSALTTSVAFFSILLMRFQGFAELGLVAGGGVLFCLLATLVLLPALLAVHGSWQHARSRPGRSIPRPPLIDRIWVAWLADHICRAPRTVTVLALVVTAILAWLGHDIRFNTNILDMLPASAESVRQQRRLIGESDLSPVQSLATASDLETLREMDARARREPTIERMDSLVRFLPAPDSDAAGRLPDLRVALDAVRLPAEADPLDRERLEAALHRLEHALAGASEAAFIAGLGGTAGALEEARAVIEESARLVRDAPATALAGWNDGQCRVLAWARRALEDLRRAARAAPPTPDSLPAPLRGRFITRSGLYIAFLHPAGDLFDDAFRGEYVQAVKRVSAQATGFPTLFDKIARQIASGFVRSVIIGAVLVVLVLLADYRRLGPTLLALAPLAMGIPWMLGGMRLLGLSYNFANLVAIPLIIGVGIDNGVHLVHRFLLEGEQGMAMVIRHTGRAILIASSTTMIGFGSLALASHRGLASLGLVLLIGVGACLIASLVVLPNLIVVLGLARR